MDKFFDLWSIISEVVGLPLTNDSTIVDIPSVDMPSVNLADIDGALYSIDKLGLDQSSIRDERLSLPEQPDFHNFRAALFAGRPKQKRRKYQPRHKCSA